MLIWLIQTPAAVTIRATASRWLTRVDKKTDTGTISAGNTVLVIRLAWSNREGALRWTVSLNNSQGSIPAKMYKGYSVARRSLHAQANLENEDPTQQQYERVDEAPDPTYGGTDEALFEIPAHQLEQQAAPLHQIPQKKGSRQSSRQGQGQQYHIYQ